MEAGIDDVGMGALIGLYNHKFEAMAMLYHTIHLEENSVSGRTRFRFRESSRR